MSRESKTYAWGARCGPHSDYNRQTGKYNVLIINSEPIRLTPKLCDEFAAANPNVLSGRSRDCAKSFLRCTNDFFVGNDQVQKLIKDKVDIKSFSVWYNERLNGAPSVWTNNEQQRFYPNRLTTHDNLHDLWNNISSWATPAERGWRGSNGWERHGVRFLARLAWWLLNKRDPSCDNWSKVKKPLMPTKTSLASIAESDSEDEEFQSAEEHEEAMEVEPAKTTAEAAAEPVEPAKTTAKAAAEPDELETCYIEDAIQKIEQISHKEYVEEHALAMQVRSKMAEDENPLAHAELVWLGGIPQLANINKSLTTDQVWKILDNAFSAMTEREYRQCSYKGIEEYYEKHPTKDGYRPIGAMYGQRAAQMDHVLAQFFSPFHHPRFYVVMPRQINTALSNRPPAARLAFGLQKSTLRILSSWVAKLRDEMKKRGFDDMYAVLPRVQQIT